MFGRKRSNQIDVDNFLQGLRRDIYTEIERAYDKAVTHDRKFNRDFQRDLVSLLEDTASALISAVDQNKLIVEGTLARQIEEAQREMFQEFRKELQEFRLEMCRLINSFRTEKRG